MDWILSSVWFNKRISCQISHWSLKNSKWKIMDFVFEKLSYFEVVVSVDNLVNRFVQIYMTWRQFWWSTKFAINISNLRLLCGGSSVKRLYEILGNTDISFYPGFQQYVCHCIPKDQFVDFEQKDPALCLMIC